MCKTVANIVLFVVNSICFIVAAILMIVGGLLQWGQDSVRNNIIPGIINMAGNTDGQKTISMNEISQILGTYISVLGNSGLILFIIGCILAVISFCGLIGVCIKNKCLLIIYILLTLAIFVLIVIFVVVFMVKRNELQALVMQSLNSTLVEKYTFHNTTLNTTSGLDITGIIDLIQARAKCCGSYNGNDYVPVKNKGDNLIPYSCCVMTSTSSFTPQYPNCTKNPSPTNSYSHIGCASKLWDIIHQYSTYTSYALIGLAIVLFILIIMAGLLIRSFSKDE